MSRIVVLGTGPTGISAIHELLLSGVKPEEISIIDEIDFGVQNRLEAKPSNRSRSIYEVVLREGANQGLGKQGLSLPNIENSFNSPSSFWGVSCLPPFEFQTSNESICPSELKNAYKKIAAEWEIQSENSRSEIFEITGEIIDKLPRKKNSSRVVDAGFAFHSRLAISTQDLENKCELTSNCFSGCPNNAPWSPSRELAKLRRNYPSLQFVQQKIVGLNLTERVLYGEKQKYNYDVLFLAAGPLNSRRLLAPNFNRKILVETTPVVLTPIFTRQKAPDVDYYESFHFADLVVPQIENKEFLSLMQLYFPTREITGR